MPCRKALIIALDSSRWCCSDILGFQDRPPVESATAVWPAATSAKLLLKNCGRLLDNC
jgi:hypothetical protein